jgi:hypothetical protein
MAAAIGTVISELEALLASGGLAGTLARGALGGLGAVSAADLLQFFLRNPTAKTKVPGSKYAIIDVHSNTTIKFLSRAAVYRLLTRKHRRFATRSSRLVIVPEGDHIERVR